MDDEAQIRITAIIVVGAMFVIIALAFSLGPWRNAVPVATAKAMMTAQGQLVGACRTLPTAPKLACLKAIVDAPVKEKAIADCNGLTTNLDERICINDAIDETSATPQDNALADCNKIAGDDVALNACIAQAMGKKQ